MKRGIRIAIPILVACLLVAVFAWLVQGKQIDVLAPAGHVANEQHRILMFALFLSALVVTPVFVLLVVFSIKYRAGNKRAKYDPEWNDNKWLEGVWWGIPIAIIGVLGVLTYQTSHSLDPYKKISGDEALQIQVVALQWKWLFIYPEYDVATVNHMPIPVERPVHFLLTTEAPMSAFWIPALGSQIYAMNGMESQLNLKATELGTFKGYNTNINGEGYSSMVFDTNVKTKAGFAAWVKQAKEAKKSLNMKSYNKLAEPSILTKQQTYTLDEPELFNIIMERNMSHGGHAE